MEHNPELEKAEADLQEYLRREREERKSRPHATLGDHMISLAAVVNFVGAVVGISIFFIAPLMMRGRGNHDTLWVVWLCSLPAAVASLGNGFAMIRISDVTAGKTKASEPDNKSGERA